MFNLVQLQERLKDVPMQALMSYANGANPNIPPYVALGELNRRKQMQEAAAKDMAAAQAPAADQTIKDQIQQQVGLMGLQQQRARQMMQNQQKMAAATPMPGAGATDAPPVQMAGGGIVALANGSQGDPIGAPAFDPETVGGMEFGDMAENVDVGEFIPKLLRDLMERAKKKSAFTAGREEPTSEERKGLPAGDVDLDEKGGGEVGIKSLLEKRAERPSKEGIAGVKPGAKGEVGDIYEKFFRDQMQKTGKSYAELLKEAGLDKRVSSNRELEEARRQLKEAEGSDSLTNRILALEAGKFGSGKLGKSAAAYESGRRDKLNTMRMALAKAEDLESKADYEFRKGNFADAQKYKDAADKVKMEAAKAGGQYVNQKAQAQASLESARKPGGTATLEAAQIRAQVDRAKAIQEAQTQLKLDPEFRKLQKSDPAKAKLYAQQKIREAVANFPTFSVGGAGAGGGSLSPEDQALLDKYK